MVEASLRELETRSIISGFLGGIHFEEVNTSTARLNYSIRMHHRKLPHTDEYFRQYDVPGPGGIQGLQYYYSGFVWLQDMIDRGFTELAAPVATPETTLPGSFVKQFPVPSYRRDNFARGIGRVFPLAMTLAWIYTVSMVCKAVVYEKEVRERDFFFGFSACFFYAFFWYTCVHMCMWSYALPYATLILCDIVHLHYPPHANPTSPSLAHH